MARNDPFSFPIDILSPPAFSSCPETSSLPASAAATQTGGQAGQLQRIGGAGLDRVLPFLPPPTSLLYSSSLVSSVGFKSHWQRAPYKYLPNLLRPLISGHPPPNEQTGSITPVPLAHASFLQLNTDWGRIGGQGERQSWERTKWAQVMGEMARSIGERKKGRSSQRAGGSPGH